MTVGGIDDYAIRQVQIKVSQSVKLLLGELFRLAGSKEIRPAGRIYKERVSCDNAPRRIRMVLFCYKERYVFRGVPGGVLNCEKRFPNAELVTILQLFMLKAVTRSSFMTEIYLC